MQVLRAGHKGVTLPAEDFDRIVTWVDLNAPYYPSYASAYPDNLAGRSPLDNAQVKRLGELTGVDFPATLGCGTNPGPLVSFERPQLSPCLAKLPPTDPRFAEAVAIIRAGAAMLTKVPRGDTPDFLPCPLDQQREAKYTARREIELRNRAAARSGTRTYDIP